MKVGLALIVAGVRAFEASYPSLGYDILINSDEETGSASSAALIVELSRNKIAALTYEPSLPGDVFARSRPGSGNFTAIVNGRAAHAGRNPEDGRNAIVAASDLALRLHRARHARMSVNPARIDGGGPTNVVPARASLRSNVRPRVSEEIDGAVNLVTRTAAEVSSEHDVAIEMHGGIGRQPKPVSNATERLFGLVAEAGAELGEDLRWQDTGASAMAIISPVSAFRSSIPWARQEISSTRRRNISIPRRLSRTHA